MHASRTTIDHTATATADPVVSPPPLTVVESDDVMESDELLIPGPYVAVKNVAERIVGLILLVVLLPLALAVALTLRLTLGKGVIFRQERVGRGGIPFTMLKFRTMQADRRSRELEVEDDRRRTHKTTDDPRHTSVGRFLRRTSLDELPQLLNVVRGDMVLIGPRPELRSVVERHGLQGHPRELVKPGITGLWQVSEYRHELLHENLHVDVEYVRTISPATDLRIAARTLGTMVRPSGA